MSEQQHHNPDQPHAIDAQMSHEGVVSELVDGQFLVWRNPSDQHPLGRYETGWQVLSRFSREKDGSATIYVRLVKPSEGLQKTLPLDEVLGWQQAGSEIDETTVPRAQVKAQMGESSLHHVGVVAELEDPESPDNAKEGTDTIRDEIVALRAEAKRFLDESGRADMVHGQQLDKLVDQLASIDRQLKEAGANGTWAGNYVRNHEIIKRSLLDFVEHAQGTIQYDFTAQDKQAHSILAKFQEVTEQVGRTADLSPDVQTMSKRLGELAQEFGTTTGVYYDDRSLKARLAQFFESAMDGRTTVSDIEEQANRLRVMLQEAAKMSLRKSSAKNQLAGDIIT